MIRINTVFSLEVQKEQLLIRNSNRGTMNKENNLLILELHDGGVGGFFLGRID